MRYEIHIERVTVTNGILELAIQGIVFDAVSVDDRLPKPKLVLFFDNGQETRRMPFPFKSIVNSGGTCTFYGIYDFDLPEVFWKTRGKHLPTELSFNFWLGDVYDEHIPVSFEDVQLEVDGYQYELELGADAIRYHASRMRRNRGIVKAARQVLTFVLNLAEYLFAIVLLPWFIVEALLSFIGVGELEQSVKNTNKLRRLIGHVNIRFASFTHSKVRASGLLRGLYMTIFTICRLFPFHKNQIAFISHRRDDLSGNFAFVHRELEKDPGLRMVYFFNKGASMANPLRILRFCKMCAQSKVILLDEFTPQIHYLTLRKQTRLFQLWHAAGAFKTFGFTRLGKPKGSPQGTRNHRSYDVVTVSSSYCIKCHSEGFGVDDKVIVPTGIPRTDVFFDEEYAATTRTRLYAKYPQLVGKKIILFAPTFRGMLKEDAYYPFDKFKVDEVLSQLDDDYVILIKHHPFVEEPHPVPEAYRDRVFDFSEYTEINDLLFIADLIITDYSSLIFEASLLAVPMLFYVFDYVEYVRDRDFYFDLDIYAPGKLVTTVDDVVASIRAQDYHTEKIEPFAEVFFDRRDGQASRAVADLVRKALADGR